MNEDTEAMTPEEMEFEEQVLDAINGEGTMLLSVEIGTGEKLREYSLKFRWPDMGDEQQIALLTSRYCNGLPPEMVPDADYEVARARAVIETLAEGPFEDAAWLPPTDEKIMHKGKKVLRPDTGKVKSRGILVAFSRKYYDTYSRFQHRAL